MGRERMALAGVWLALACGGLGPDEPHPSEVLVGTWRCADRDLPFGDERLLGSLESVALTFGADGQGSMNGTLVASMPEGRADGVPDLRMSWDLSVRLRWSVPDADLCLTVADVALEASSRSAEVFEAMVRQQGGQDFRAATAEAMIQEASTCVTPSRLDASALVYTATGGGTVTCVR